MDQTWSKHMKAIHKQWMALRRAGLQHEFQEILGVGFCYVLGMWLFVVVAIAVAICKSKGQCYHRWIAHRM